MDPVSWLQVEQGWRVVAADGVDLGTVAQVEGDKSSDIFDGLAVAAGEPSRLLYVPGEQVGVIRPGEVTLKIASAEASALGEFRAPPPETELRPRRQPLTTRLTNWLRGSR